MDIFEYNSNDEELDDYYNDYKVKEKLEEAICDLESTIALLSNNPEVETLLKMSLNILTVCHKSL